ncbi:MAG TPA: hypothetical protein VGM93_03685, partial [Acidimicrobiales bacterium]
MLVDVHADDPAALAPAALAATGALVTAVAPGGDLATVAIAPDRLDDLAALPGLVGATEDLRPTLNDVDASQPVGSGQPGVVTKAATCPTGVVSEGDAQLKAALARSTYSVTGAGVKIGILSDSFDKAGTHAATDVASADLPGSGNTCGKTTPVTVLAEDHDSGDEDEGRAMAQIVHDLAPDAQLYFATAFAGEVAMANSIRAMRDAGAKVIVDDISYDDDPMYQDGVITQAVDEVQASGVAYFSSAGNSNAAIGSTPIGSYGTKAYRPMACPRAFTYATSCHDFDPGAGTDAGDLVTVPSGQAIDVSLGADEPAYGITTDFDLYLIDPASSNTAVAYSQNTNAVTGLTFERAYYYNNTGSPRTLRVVVGRRETAGTPAFTLNFYRARFTAVQWTTPTGGDTMSGTSYGHNIPFAGAGVAAVNASNSAALES